jgi:hypothetical protein
MKATDIKWIPEVADVASRLHESAKLETSDGARVRAERIRRLGTSIPGVWRAISDNDKREKLFEAACSSPVGTTKRKEIAKEVDRRNEVANELRRLASFLPADKRWMAHDVAWYLEEAARKLAS